ncbi:MAG: Crp/Fnr family transcriptional regulator [Rhodoferax sp.]
MLYYGLHPAEKSAIASGAWFQTLPQRLQQQMLARAVPQRYAHGQRIASARDPIAEWMGCARGVVRICNAQRDSSWGTQDLLGPGEWSVALPCDPPERYGRDLRAHGDTTILSIGQADLRQLCQMEPALHHALLALTAAKVRLLTEKALDKMALSPADLLDKHYHQLQARHTRHARSGRHLQQTYLTRPLTQEILASVLGLSRQRLNQHLGVGRKAAP